MHDDTNARTSARLLDHSLEPRRRWEAELDAENPEPADEPADEPEAGPDLGTATGRTSARLLGQRIEAEPYRTAQRDPAEVAANRRMRERAGLPPLVDQ